MSRLDRKFKRLERRICRTGRPTPRERRVAKAARHNWALNAVNDYWSLAIVSQPWLPMKAERLNRWRRHHRVQL